MRHVITIDFGSTFTKVAVTDLIARKIILTDKVPSTVGSDARIGMRQCFDLAERVLEKKNFQKALKLASSSAAGGLRMSVAGLSKSLSSLAGKGAALGAGAKVIKECTGKLNEEKARALAERDTEIILFLGGYERGNSEMLIANASMLAASDIRAPIIYAGNSDVSREIRTMMKSCGKKCYMVENIIPQIGVLNVEPTQEVIRDLFLRHITDMKGFREVKKCFDNDMVPTPAAVLAAGELLNRGTEKKKGFGNLMIVDVGGATTDIYSFNENETCRGAKSIGLEEPFTMRTVEGDLGMRENAGTVVEQEGTERFARELGISEGEVQSALNERISDTGYLPDSEIETLIDDKIASIAVGVAARRHAGRIRPSYEGKGRYIQSGKNMENIAVVVGTGGILVHNRKPHDILNNVVKIGKKDRNILLPEHVDTFLDTDYVLFSAGLLREVNEEAAFDIMKNSIKPCTR